MNYDQYTGILRALVPGFVGWAVGKGYIPAGLASDVIAAIVTVGAAAWSVFNNQTGKVIGK